MFLGKSQGFTPRNPRKDHRAGGPGPGPRRSAGVPCYGRAWEGQPLGQSEWMIFMYVDVYVFIYLFVYLLKKNVYLYMLLYVCLFICLCIYLCVYISLCLHWFIYLRLWYTENYLYIRWVTPWYEILLIHGAYHNYHH